MAETSFLNAVRRTRRAYIGAHVMAFDFARKRASYRLNQLKNFGSSLVNHGEDVEAKAFDVFDAAKDKVSELNPLSADMSPTIDVKPTRVAKKPKPAKPADMSTDITPKAETDPTDAAQAGKIIDDKYTPHIEAVLKYDAEANPVHIKKIVDHLGVALTSRDGKYVACSDPSERETVAQNWLLKSLGVEASADALDAKVMAICEEMKADRMKPRATFYYLLAKAEGKLGAL